MKSTNNNSEDPLSQAEPTAKTSACCSLNQWLILAVAVVVTAFVAGGGVFWLMNNRLASEQAALEQRIVDLQNQVAQTQPASAVESEIDITSVSTEDWETYRNEDFSFEIKYPKDWGIANRRDNNRVITDITIKPQVNSETSSFRLMAGETTAHGAELLNPDPCRIDTVVIGGITTNKESHCGLSSYAVDSGAVTPQEFELRKSERFIFTEISKNKIEYSFEFYVKSPEYYGYEKDVFDKILSTFRFTN
ncbi:MAG: hypothetical protein Q8L21_01855 [Candidatus Komeilibacteria bacterium]|nr:hypothetical protein [Candidatus Komeilibacteria bacterium]